MCIGKMDTHEAIGDSHSGTAVRDVEQAVIARLKVRVQDYSHRNAGRKRTSPKKLKLARIQS